MTTAARPARPDGEHAIHLLAQMTRVRRFEERCVERYSGSHIRGFLHLGIGQEACAVGVTEALAEDDGVVATYREHGHALARGMPMRTVMAELEGKWEGCCHGRGGSMHLFDVSRRFYGGNAIVAGGLPLAVGLALARGMPMRTVMAELEGKWEGCCHGRGGSMHLFDVSRRFYGGNAIVAGGLPLAVGLALADTLAGRERATVCFFGDGAVAEGEFHEAMNLAALWKLPVLFCCENNRYAMGTAIERALSETDLATKAAAYRMPAWSVDGMDVVAVEEATRAALPAVRAGRPHFLALETYRFRAHSMYDPERYRDKAEVDEWRRRDPIPALAARVVADGLATDEELERLEADVAAEVDDAVAFAIAGTLEPSADLLRFVVADTRVTGSEP